MYRQFVVHGALYATAILIVVALKFDALRRVGDLDAASLPQCAARLGYRALHGGGGNTFYLVPDGDERALEELQLSALGERWDKAFLMVDCRLTGGRPEYADVVEWGRWRIVGDLKMARRFLGMVERGEIPVADTTNLIDSGLRGE